MSIPHLLISVFVALSLSLPACGGEDGYVEVDCSGSLLHFYGVGCGYLDLETGADIPVGEMVRFCRGLLVDGDAQCRNRLNNWLLCHELADGSSAASCDCGAELDDLIAGC